MQELIRSYPWSIYLLPALLALLILLLWYLKQRGRNARARLRKALRGIAHEYRGNLIIPNGDGGEIHIDHLVLTAKGLLVIDVKEVTGIVFGSDKMQDWTVIASDRRFTFANPQPAILDRVAAVRMMVEVAPVTGKLLFLDGAEFSKGTPGLVCQLADLESEFSDQDRQTATASMEGYRPDWEQVLAGSRPSN